MFIVQVLHTCCKKLKYFSKGLFNNFIYVSNRVPISNMLQIGARLIQENKI